MKYRVPSFWISLGCLMVFAIGLYCIRDGLSGKLLPDWAQRWQIGWKPISSGIRIFLGLILAYGSFLAFLKDYCIPGHPIATGTVWEMTVFLFFWLIWPFLMIVCPMAILPWSVPLLIGFLILSFITHWHMSREIQKLNRKTP